MRASKNRALLLKAAGAAALLCILALIWRFTPLYELADFDVLRDAIGSLKGNPLAPLIVIAIFVAGSFILFPVTVLTAAASAALGLWLGVGPAVAGVLISASLMFAIGRLVGRRPLHAALGPRLERVQDKIVGNGIVAVALVRMLPAPFSIVSILAGAGGIRFIDFMIGTIIGLIPAMTAMMVFGAQLAHMLDEPTWEGVGILVICLTVWLAFAAGAQIVITRFVSPR